MCSFYYVSIGKIAYLKKKTKARAVIQWYDSPNELTFINECDDANAIKVLVINKTFI